MSSFQPSGQGGAPGFSFTPTAPAAGNPAPTTGASTTTGGAFVSSAPASGVAPATGASLFGGTNAGTGSAFGAAPTPAYGAAPASTGGGAATGNTAPAPAGFGTSSSGTNSFGGFGTFGMTPAQGAALPVPVPEYEDAFPGHFMWKKVHSLARKAQKGDSLAGQELKQVLSTDEAGSLGSRLLNLGEVWKWEGYDQNLRSQMQQTGAISFWGKEHSLQPATRDIIFQLANELRLSEKDALCLYARTIQVMPGADVAAMRDCYFEERSQFLKTLLFLLQGRLEVGDGSLYLQATDALLLKGLVPNLLKLIQQTSVRLTELATHVTRNASLADSHQQFVWSHWNFGIQERQRAAECLFFIAYHTQMELQEIVALVDTVQFLSNEGPNHSGLREFSPFDDAPSAYEDGDQHVTQMQYGWFTGGSQRKEKDPSVWRKELVEECLVSGQPQLLRCVSILLVTGIAALDTNLELFDRNTHARNSFGPGNALIPRDASGMLNHLAPLDSKLCRDVSAHWRRLDIFGIMVAAYGLLLKTVPSALTSPRAALAGPTAGTFSPQEIRRRRAEALDFPTQWRSFTFGRLCLIPGVAVQPDPSSVSARDTESHALEVLCGFTERYLDAIAGSPPVSREKWLLDAQEDLLFRQQDERQRQEFHQWSGTTGQQTESVPQSVDILERPDCMDDVIAFSVAVGYRGPSNAFWDFNGRLVPSRAMCCLEKLKEGDETLRAPFFDFLSMLAAADGWGASKESNGAESLHLLLARESKSPGDTITTTWIDILDVIRYYARSLVDKDNLQTSQQASSSTGGQSTVYYYFSEGTRASRNSQSSKKSSTSSKRRLNADGEHLLSSGLSLLDAIASRSSNARSYLRSLPLPVTSSDGILGRDSTLLVLFTLATAPVPPEIRGLVFRSIASILDGCTHEEAQNAWGIVESSGFLPIHKLQQYPTEIGENNAPRIGFPTSLTAQIREKVGVSPIPADHNYSIMFEMEYIESLEASYPSTTGFLVLVTSLIRNGGCPSNLGHNWRARTGCAPYVEYAMDFVIPRALGSFGPFPALGFRSNAEKNLLCASALELISTVASLYLVPYHSNAESPLSLSDCVSLSKAQASKKLGLERIAESLVVPPKESDFMVFAKDFLHGSSASGGFQATALPSPKSPGFTVLFRAFQTHRRSLFPNLELILSADDVGHPTTDADDLRLSMALFGRLQPSFESSKSSKPHQSSKLSKLLVGLQAQGSTDRFNAQNLRLGALSNVLRILCILASREDAFYENVSEACITQMVPTLRLNTKPGPPDVWVLNFTGTRAKMESSSVIRSVVACVRSHDSLTVSSLASVLLFLLKDAVNIVSHGKEIGEALADMFFHLSSLEPMSVDAAGLFSFALEWILVELKKAPPCRLVASVAIQPILEALTSAVTAVDISVKEGSYIASLIYETIVLIHRVNPAHTSPLSFYLGSLANLKHFVPHAASGHAPAQIFTSVAWVLTGIADQLAVSSNVQSLGVSLKASQSSTVVRNMIEGGELVFLFRLLCTDTTGHVATLSGGLHRCLGACILAASTAGNALPLREIVSTVLKKLCENLDETTQRNLALCLYMSVDHTEIPSSAVLDVSSVICDAIIKTDMSKPLLVASLTITLNHADEASWDLSQDQVDDIFLQVSPTLFVMACQVCASVPATPSSDALAARGALKVLFKLASERAVHRALLDSVSSTAKKTFLDSIVSLVAELDGDITNLVCMVARFSFGGGLLFSSGILHTLQKAAIRYRGWMDSHHHQFPSAPISPPLFLIDHLLLVNCVLDNGLTEADETVHQDACLQVLSLLDAYDDTILHALRNFTSNADICAEYFRCLSITKSILGHVSQYPVHRSELKAVIPQFVFQFLQHPLPKQCRGPLPSLLVRISEQAVDGSTRNDSTESIWWDQLLLRNSSQLGYDDICFFGKTAADIALAGLSFVQGSDTIPSADPVTVGRSLIASADSVLYLDRYALSHQGMTENARLLRERLVWIIMELLRVSYGMLHNLYQDHGAREDANTVAIFLAALDRAKLHSLNQMGPRNADRDPECVLDELVSKLYAALKRHS